MLFPGENQTPIWILWISHTIYSEIFNFPHNGCTTREHFDCSESWNFTFLKTLSLSLSGFLWWVPSQHSQHQLRPHLGFMNKIRGWDKQDAQTLPVSHSGDKIAPGIKINISSCNFIRSPSKIFMLFLVFLVLINR